MSWLGRTVSGFPPLEAYVAHSSTITTSPEEGAFRSSADQRPLSPVSEEHGTFSNEDLSFTSGGAIAICWTTSPDQQLKRGFVMLAVGAFCSVVVCSWMKHYYLREKILILYVDIYTQNYMYLG